MQFVSNQIQSLDMKSTFFTFFTVLSNAILRRHVTVISDGPGGKGGKGFLQFHILPFCWFLVYAAVDAVKCAKQCLQRSFVMVGNLLCSCVHTAKRMSSAAEDRFKCLVITNHILYTTIHYTPTYYTAIYYTAKTMQKIVSNLW